MVAGGGPKHVDRRVPVVGAGEFDDSDLSVFFHCRSECLRLSQGWNSNPIGLFMSVRWTVAAVVCAGNPTNQTRLRKYFCSHQLTLFGCRAGESILS